MAVGQELFHDPTSVVYLDHIRAYPNGFVMVIELVSDPREPTDPHRNPVMGPPTGDQLRVGVQFSDGRRGGQRAGAPRGLVGLPPGRGDSIPTRPLVRRVGGGGGGGRFGQSWWVHPLPAPGELTVHAQWAAIGMPESALTIDASVILDAAMHAIVAWR